MSTPLDLEFFESVIAYNALKNETYLCSIIDHVRGEYFDNKDIGSVISLITTFYNDRGTIPTTTEIKSRITTKEERQSFINVVTSFKSLDTKYNIDELIANTEHFLRQKAVFNAVLEAADGINSQSVSPSETLNQFEKACNINLVNDFGLDIVNDVDDFITRISEDTVFIPTGYQWLDKMLGGGWVKTGKALYVFSAATNVGKSIMLGNLASNLVALNKNAVMFTLEMSEEMYGKRIASNLTSIPIGSLKENSDILKDDMVTIQEENTRSHLIIKEFPTKGATVRTIEAYLKKLIEQRKIKPDVIFVDYLNLLAPSISTGNTYLDIKSIAEELRRLSYKFGGIPVVSATQLNRSAYDQLNPGIETTSESMGLSHTVDAQIALWASEEDREMGLLHAGMQKSRFGARTGKNGTFNVDWDTLRLTESSDVVLEGRELENAHSILTSLGD